MGGVDFVKISIALQPQPTGIWKSVTAPLVEVSACQIK